MARKSSRRGLTFKGEHTSRRFKAMQGRGKGKRSYKSIHKGPRS